MSATNKTPPIIIKKYANRRLYDTSTSCYITLEEVRTMVKDGMQFVVQDAKTGDDITRSVLTQIIFEQEGKGEPLLPVNFLRWLIGFYGDGISELVPHYLEASMTSFTKNQEKMRGMLEGTLGKVFPFSQFEEISKQNMALFQKAFSMFTPFESVFGAGGEPEERPANGNKNKRA